MTPCRNATQKSKKGHCVALKREDRVLEQHTKTFPKQRSNRPRYRRTHHRIWNQGHKGIINMPKISGERLRRIANVMQELHLPFPTMKGRKYDISEEVLPPYLRWSLDERNSVLEECWNDVRYLQEHKTPLMKHASLRGPAWNQPPSRAAHLGIFDAMGHFAMISTRNPPLQIPSYWPVFKEVSWGPAHFLYQAPTDSSDNKTPKQRSSDPDQIILFEGDSDAGDRENVSCQAETVLGARLRGFWTWLSAIVPHRFHWLHQTKERSLRRNRRRHVGYLDLNQSSHNYDIWPQTSIESLLCFWENGNCVHELSWPSLFGRLIINAVATDMFPAHNRQILQWPPPFAQLGDMPLIDYTCRVRKEVMSWKDDFSPLLFAAQYRGNDMELAIKQLAMAFQPMMTLLVFYHLDCRASVDEPLASWMILYGAIYDEDGLTIYAHAPHFAPPLSESDNVQTWGWSASSSMILHHHDRIVYEEPNQRGSFFATLNRIQGHCAFVLEKLMAWDGYERAVSRILQA